MPRCPGPVSARIARRVRGSSPAGLGLTGFPVRGTLPVLQGEMSMARHNREARGSDQNGYEYTISYQPDWLRQVKVTRLLDNGRQSTRTLFANPDRPERNPGRQVRTRIESDAQ